MSSALKSHWRFCIFRHGMSMTSRDICYHSHQTCHNSLNLPSLKYAHTQMRFLSSWRAWFSFLDELFLWIKQLRTLSLLSFERATSEQYFFPSGYVCVWSVDPASREAKMWHRGLKEGSRAYRRDFGISNPVNTPCHISKPRLTTDPIPSLVFSRHAY